MQATEVFAETARWLRYAEEDLITAETLLAQPHIPPRQACWHAQQAAEKALKAVLIFLQIDFPRTHDLNVLRSLVPNSWHFKTAHPNLARLTDWVADARYPGDVPEPTKAEAITTVKHARAVCTDASTELAQHGFLVEKSL